MVAVRDDTGLNNTHSTALEQGALRGFRLRQFDPAKPDTYKGWEAAFTAGVSESTAAAIGLGTCPTFDQAARMLPASATETQIGDALIDLIAMWDQAQAEAFRIITLSIDFTSAKGKMLLERINREYAKERRGIELLLSMRRKYASHHSFSKQQALIDKLQPEVLASEISEIGGPDEADDYLTMLYGDVWLQVKGNNAAQPLDFVRRVLVAMSTVEGKVSQLAFQHTCALDAALHACEEAEWGSAADVPGLSQVYREAETFISAVSKSWPTAPRSAFTLKRTNEPRKKLTTEAKCATCNCHGCDGNPCYATNPQRQLGNDLTDAQVKFINIARAYVAKHGSAGLKNVAFSVWKRGGDAPAGTAKATQREEVTNDDGALDSQLGEGALDPDTLAELLDAAGYEIEAELAGEEGSPMLHVTTRSRSAGDNTALRVQDTLKQGGDADATTEQLMHIADVSAEPVSAPAAPPPDSPVPALPAPRAAPRKTTAAHTSTASPVSLAEFVRRLDGSPAAEPAPPAAEVAPQQTAAAEKYRHIIRALVESRATALPGGRGGVAAIASAVLGATAGWHAVAWRIVQGVALLRLADSMGAGRLLWDAAAKVWPLVRSLGGKAAQAVLDKFLSVARAAVAQLYARMRPRGDVVPPTRGGFALATRGALSCSTPQDDEPGSPLTAAKLADALAAAELAELGDAGAAAPGAAPDRATAAELAADAEVVQVLGAVQDVVRANFSAHAAHEAVGGPCDFLLEPGDAQAAEVIAWRLGAAPEGDGHNQTKTLACYTNGAGENAFLAMQTGNSVALLTKSGIVEIEAPEGYREASESEGREAWLQSMGIEMRGTEGSYAYSLVPLSGVTEGMPIFQPSWKYKLEYERDGTLDKYKSRCARMCGHGCPEPLPVGACTAPARPAFADCAARALAASATDLGGAHLSEGPGDGAVFSARARRPGFAGVGPSDGVSPGAHTWRPPGFAGAGCACGCAAAVQLDGA